MESLPDDIDAHARVPLNDPARALVAASRDLDVLVLGSRGFGPIGAIWAGSVSSRAMREASCPVIVVPRRVLPALTEPATAASA
jgi:nucleotide-binding universal stress UspA family protein